MPEDKRNSRLNAGIFADVPAFVRELTTSTRQRSSAAAKWKRGCCSTAGAQVPAGGAFAGGTTIDSFDAHDGHALIKGHASVVVLPRALPATTANSY